MFGVTKEEVEDIVDRKICKVTGGTQFLTAKPCPPPIVWEYMIVVGKSGVVAYFQTERGKDPMLYQSGYSVEVYTLISDKRFKKVDDAMDFVISKKKQILKAGFSIGKATVAHELKRELDA